VTEKNIQSQNVTFVEIAQHVRSRLFSAIGTSIVVNGRLLLFSLMLIVPGFIMEIKYVFTDFAMLLCGCDTMKVLEYSEDLVKGRWFKTLGMYLLLLLSWGIPYLVVSVVFGFAAGIVETFTRNFIPLIVIYFTGPLAVSLLANHAVLFFRIMQTVWFLNWDYRRIYAAVPSPGGRL